MLVTQNVMTVCSHDMLFTFMYAGWEGTTNDSRVFYDVVVRPENKFSVPVGGKLFYKFLLTHTVFISIYNICVC